jgi:hypothetical protein
MKAEKSDVQGVKFKGLEARVSVDEEKRNTP